jgi:YVTN family beta-propeller protein
MADLDLGSVVAGCRIEEVVGRGGMGVVYRATQLSLDRTVALKAIVPELAGNEEFRERFKRESRIAASIEHPNVIPVYEAGEGDGLLYLTMRYVEGTDLRSLIDTEGPLDPERGARIVAQVAAALAVAHRRGLVHRDVKPANVLIDSAEEREHAYLTDFGIARHSAGQTALTRTGAVVGTLDYLAPEQLQGESADARADVYALGCVLFEALTGTIPFPRDSEAAKMFAHLSAPVPSPREVHPEVPPPLDTLAQRAMAKDPGERIQTTTELAEALLAQAGAGPTPPLPPPSEPGVAEPTAEVPAGEAATGTPPTEVAAPPTEVGAPPTEAAVPPTEAAVPPTEAVPPGAPAAEAPGTGAGATPAAPPRPARRRRVAEVVGGLVAAAVTVAVAVLVLSGGGDSSEEGSKPAGSEGSLAPRALPPVRLGRGNAGVVAGEGSVWVADRREDVVRRLDPESRRVVSTIRVGDEPRNAIALGEGGVWVTNAGDDTVSRIDPATEEVTTAPVGDTPVGVDVRGGAVWTANEGDGTATRFDPATNRVRTARVGRQPVHVVVAGGTAWVTAEGDGTVVPLDASTAAADGSPIRVGGAPRGITFAGGALWVAASGAGAVVVIDPSSRRVITRIPVGANPRQVYGGEGAVWVTSADAGLVVAIDPSSRKIVARVRVQGEPRGLAVGEGRVWAASESGLLTPIDPRGG